MKYPTAIDPDKVGEYPVMVYAGGGYFFDEVLEYRIWCYPENGAKNINNNDGESDNYHSFATYQEALEFADNTQNAERPLVLVRQLEWIDQPSRGVYIHNIGERLTEWRPEWLERGARKMDDISQFLQKNT